MAPGSAAQRLAQAQAAHGAGDLQAAASVYAQLTQDAQATLAERADGYYGLGTVHFQRGDLARALASLDAAVAIDGGVAEYHFNRALVLERLRRRDEAIAAFVHAVDVAGGDRGVLRPATERLLRLNASRQALGLLDRAAGDDTLDGLRAQALAGAGDWAGACALARRMTDAQPQDAKRWQWRSQAAAALRDYDDAVAAHERYLSLLIPATGEDYLAHTDLLLSARRPEEARTALDTAKARGAGGLECTFLDARLARLEDDLPAAVAAAWKVLDARANDGRAWQLLAELVPAEVVSPAADRLAAVLQSPEPFRPGHELLLRFAFARLKERQGELATAWQALEAANGAQRAALAGRGVAYDADQESLANTQRLQAFGTLASTSAPASTASNRPTVLFILGMPRSGTTLMERIVGGLDGVHMGGENEAMAFIAARYEHAQRQGSLPAPAAMTAAQWRALSDDYDARSLPPGPGELAALTDKMPHNMHHVGLIAGMFAGRARVVWMRRHPLDVCLSIYSRRFPDGHRYACDLADLAHFYAESERLMSAWREAFPWLVHEVRYEALVADPQKHARSVVEHAGLRWDPACLETTMRREAAFTFSELQVREAINVRRVHRHQAWGELLDPMREALREVGVDC